MTIRNKIKLIVAAAVLGTAAVATSLPVYAGNAGAFIGGVFATKVMTNMNDRTEAEQQQAAAAQYQAAQPVQQAPAQKSPQARIAELDKLAAGGYITPAEYKQKKQAILDSM
jgi:membrane protease subunit (stomatin/prohibitin family)